LRGAQHAVGSVGDQPVGDRLQVSLEARPERTGGRGGQIVQPVLQRRATLRRVVVVLLRIDVDLLPVALELEVEPVAEILIELALDDPLFGKIIRLEGGVDDPRIGGIGRIGEHVRTVQAANREVGSERRLAGRNAPQAEEFLRGENGPQRRVAVGEGVVEPRIQAAEHPGRIALAQLLLDAHAPVVFVEVLCHDVQRGAARGFPPHRTADAVHVAVVVAIAVELVERVAVAVEIIAGHPDAERVADREVDHALELNAVVVAVIGLARRAEAGEIGPRGAQVDHARGGVAAEQRSLRPAQHFDLRQVVEFAFEQAGAEQRRIVEVDRGGAVAGHADAQVADPADGEAGRGEVGLGERDVGKRQLKIGRGLDLLPLERLGRKRTDRDRNVLQRFRAALGGDDDDVAVVEPVPRVGVLRSALRVCRKYGNARANAREQGGLNPHQSSPRSGCLCRSLYRGPS